MPNEPTKHPILTAFEADAEFLVLDQLDLLAQVEAQLRAVNHTMRAIEKLRGGKHRVGPELSAGARADTLQQLDAELEELDAQLVTQHSSCQHMLQTVEKMRHRLASVKGTGRGLDSPPRQEPPAQGEPPDRGSSGLHG